MSAAHDALARTMRYPVTTPTGVLTEIGLARKSADPFYDRCPSWCTDAVTGHQLVEFAAEDRVHYGPVADVPLRLMPGDLDRDDTVILATARMWLSRRVQHREPTVWLGHGETDKGFDLTLDEARAIGEGLLRLCEAAE